MKVLMTADTIGGVWTFAMELIGALHDEGVEVALATMGRMPSPDQRMQAAQLSNLTLHPSDFKLEWMSDPWDDVERAGRWLLSIRDKVAPDLVHLNTFAHGTLPWKAPLVVTAHACMASWWEAVRNRPFPAKWNRYRHAVRSALHAADFVTAPTRAMATAVEQIYELPRQPRVIRNGRRADLFTPGPKHPFILSAGRFWDEAKNLAALDAAAAGLCWPVYVAGPLQHPDRVAKSPAFNARLLGMLPLMHMRQWMTRADIYALPARYEPFGLSVLEAALAQCALVLGDIASLRETWEGAAVFAPPDDPQALRSQLGALIKEPVRRRQLAADARARALLLSPKRMASEYANLYRQLIDEHSQVSAVNSIVKRSGALLPS